MYFKKKKYYICEIQLLHLPMDTENSDAIGLYWIYKRLLAFQNQGS